MQQRTLGQSDLQVSVVGLGANNFGGRMETAATRAVVHKALDCGVTLIDPKSIDKLSRLYSVQHLFSEGVIYAPDLRWADQVIHQCEVFPKGKHDDLVDTVSMALRHMRELNLLTRPPERLAEIDSMRAPVGKEAVPLYPA